MNRHREIQMTDVVLAESRAKEVKEKTFESMQFSIIDGEPCVIVNVSSTVYTTEGKLAGHTVEQMRLELDNAVELYSDLNSTTLYLRHMNSNFNPQPF